MKEDENIVSFFVRVNEIVNGIKELGENIDEDVVVQNMLRSIPSRFEANMFAMEEL